MNRYSAVSCTTPKSSSLLSLSGFYLHPHDSSSYSLKFFSLAHSSHSTAAFLPDDKSAIAGDHFFSLGKYSSAELTRRERALLVALNRVRR
jgi:hypothetical protein